MWRLLNTFKRRSQWLKHHNYLITYILFQIKASGNPDFLSYIQDLHVQYQEAKLPWYTPSKLINDVKEKIHVLKHVDLWAPMVTNMPSMALHSTTAIGSQLQDFLAYHITSEIKCLIGTTKLSETKGRDGKHHFHFQHQEWMFTPFENKLDTRVVGVHVN